ncbi:MAG TPA: glutamine synthetase [Gemmatimonadetes bacterium]|nr:glutamine synthetase [Gemmatimonadota bacterium]
MKTVKFEYVWLDGHETPNLRSKVKVVEWMPKEDIIVKNLPMWNFDGSSTNQAPGSASECLLKPVRIYPWNMNYYIVLCEVQNIDGTDHSTNARSGLRKLIKNADQEEFWWGFEQEYFVTKDRIPLGFPQGGYPKPQGLYYCGVGGNQVRARGLVETHLTTCLGMDIFLTGTNAEVAIGQWEYQCFAKDTLKACDDLWVSRYVLYRLAEEVELDIDISPKPVPGNWNGSGCHTNYSNKFMREEGGKKWFMNLLDRLKSRHADHILAYGKDNSSRLTGKHETQHMDKFSWGVADRGASIRVPFQVEQNDWKGYIEDRRPAANCDPYQVARLILETTLDDQYTIQSESSGDKAPGKK